MAYRCRVAASERSRRRSSAVFSPAHVSFGLVGRRRDAQVGEEPQYVVAAVVQAFQQQPARGCFSLLPGTRRTCDSRPARRAGTASAPFAMLASGTACRPCSRALFAAWMRARRFAGDLTGPDRVRVGLGGVLNITKEVGCAELVHDAGELVVVDVPVVYHHDAGPVSG